MMLGTPIDPGDVSMLVMLAGALVMVARGRIWTEESAARRTYTRVTAGVIALNAIAFLLLSRVQMRAPLIGAILLMQFGLALSSLKRLLDSTRTKRANR
jgi:hypothetical protein